jgi:TusE/DsrC/DsvC family sulfur relay protein
MQSEFLDGLPIGKHKPSSIYRSVWFSELISECASLFYIDCVRDASILNVAFLNSVIRILSMAGNGNLLKTDAEGYLVDPSDWTETFANEVARREGIVLGDEHWKVVHFMRGWLEENGVAPDARHVMKFLTGDREVGRRRLFELFPYGYVKQACKIAGMKKPRAWSTG